MASPLRQDVTQSLLYMWGAHAHAYEHRQAFPNHRDHSHAGVDNYTDLTPHSTMLLRVEIPEAGCFLSSQMK